MEINSKIIQCFSQKINEFAYTLFQQNRSSDLSEIKFWTNTKNMDLRIYKEAEQFVFDSFNKAEKPSQIKHFVQTVHWLKILSPDADEALLVAAIAHDIERAFRLKDVLEKKTSVGFTSVEFYRPHEERGAEIIADFLKHQNVDDGFIERVKLLSLSMIKQLVI